LHYLPSLIENGSLPKREGDTTLLQLSFFAPQSISEEARRASILFWLKEEALPSDVAEQRSAQVICHATLDDRVIGVASGHVIQYRTYIGQAQRRQGYAGKMLAES
jgi:hypothetical protein